MPTKFIGVLYSEYASLVALVVKWLVEIITP